MRRGASQIVTAFIPSRIRRRVGVPVVKAIWLLGSQVAAAPGSFPAAALRSSHGHGRMLGSQPIDQGPDLEQDSSAVQSEGADCSAGSLPSDSLAETLLKRGRPPMLGKSPVSPSLRRISAALSPLHFFVPINYDYALPTCENYKASSDEFSGRFKDIRATRDRAYHGNYVPARQALQDVLVRDVCAGGAPQDAPWIVFTAGAMGAGKSHVVNWMSSEGHFPLPNIVQIDPDAFRSRLPEWGTYLSRDPLMAGRLTHRECGYCVELAQESALQQRKHIWVDGSLRNSEWYRQVFADIRARHPCYRIAILHIHASEAAVMDRVRARALLTGRYVPEEELTRSLRDVPAAVEALTSSVDFYAKIANEPGESPKLLKFCNETLCRVMESGDEWSQVSSRFGLESSEDQVRATRQSIEVLVSRHDVFLISKSYCSFCQTAKSRLASAEISFEALDIDTLPQGVLIQTEAARMTGSRTTPMVFVRGRFVGGCNETVGLIQTGKLRAMLDGIPKLAE